MRIVEAVYRLYCAAATGAVLVWAARIIYAVAEAAAMTTRKIGL